MKAGIPSARPCANRLAFEEKLGLYRKMGFEGIQFHDDDAVPDMNDLTPAQVIAKATAMRQAVENEGLTPNSSRAPVGGSPYGGRRVHGQQQGRPRIRAGALQAHAGHRPRPRHATDRVVAVARGHLHARGQGRQAGGATHCGRHRHDAGLRPGSAHSHRTQAQRTAGPDLHPHHGSRPRAGGADGRPESRGRADRERARHPGRDSTPRTRWATPWRTTSCGACTSTTRTG